MAEEDKDSKTEEATEKRRNEAFEKGNFAQAQEIGMAFVLLASLLVFWGMGDQLAGVTFSVSKSILGNLDSIAITENNMEHLVALSIKGLGRLAGPFMIAGFVAAVLAGGVQSGFKLTPKALRFDPQRLDPVQGAKKLVSKDTLIRFGIDLLKLAAMAFILYGAALKIVRDPIFHSPVDFRSVGNFIADTLVYVLVRLTVAVAIIAAISYFYQRSKTAKDLRMTKHEVKQERKDQDQSPEVKKTRMQMAMRLMKKQMLQEVPTADVVVTNPTHYAVALKYERGLDEAPVVLAKGENAFAQRIKDVARAHEVPIVENKLVARMLYKHGRVGEGIPAQLYQSAAEILAFVYKAHRYYFHKLKARRAEKRRA